MNKDQFLRRTTGKDSAYWVARVQAEVLGSIIVGTDEVHPDCDMRSWTGAITNEIIERVEEAEAEGKGFDGNIRTALILAVVLSCWASRISHAKAYDPNRPLRLRRRALKAHRENVQALIDAIVDETKDAAYFAGQEWDPPYGPSPRDGDFV